MFQTIKQHSYQRGHLFPAQASRPYFGKDTHRQETTPLPLPPPGLNARTWLRKRLRVVLTALAPLLRGPSEEPKAGVSSEVWPVHRIQPLKGPPTQAFISFHFLRPSPATTAHKCYQHSAPSPADMLGNNFGIERL